MRSPLTASAALCIIVSLFARPAWAGLESGVYQVTPGATVEERGDRVQGGSRVVPLFARLTFDLSSNEPSLTAVITNAVLEGGDPFLLTVHSSSGQRRTDGSYWFSGDYLRELHPSGTQYLFDWKFSESTNGDIVWNGITGWAGGHIWYVTITNITLIAVPRLEVAQAGSHITLAWPALFADFLLEHSETLPTPGWSPITNRVDLIGNRFSVTVAVDSAQRFFRLRQLDSAARGTQIISTK